LYATRTKKKEKKREREKIEAHKDTRMKKKMLKMCLDSYISLIYLLHNRAFYK
jgi:hypothetical protein